MGTIKTQIFENERLKQYMKFPKYADIYIMMKPDFSKIESKNNKEEIINNILEYQEKARFIIAEYHFLKGTGLEKKFQDISNDTLNFMYSQIEFSKKIDKSICDNSYSFEGSFEECDTLADKFIHRVFTIQELLAYYVNNSNDKLVTNEIKNFHEFGMIIFNYFLSVDLLHYFELIRRRPESKGYYNDEQLFQQLSEFANFYLSETTEYNELYNKTMNKKNCGKQLKKKVNKK